MSLTAQWLGQAGFLLEWSDSSARTARILIDPYLSDSLAEKYRGKLFPHTRLRAAPLDPEELPEVLAVLCTHRHTDHMDPGTLIPLFRNDPDALLVAPAAEAAEARTRSGLTEERMRLLDAGEEVQIGGATIHAVPAAHEELEFDDLGRSRFLGYVVDVAGVRIYHSGDCAPYEGQAALLRDLSVDIALLPVNGRDAYRRENGVPGNFSFTEAVELCAQARIPRLVAHHWGMFSFNTADPASFPRDEAQARGVEVIVPEHAARLALGRAEA